MTDYIKLELYLMDKSEHMVFFEDLIKKKNISSKDTKEFLKRFDNFEFFYIAEILQKDSNLINEMSAALDMYYFSPLSSKNPEIQALLDLIAVINIAGKIKVDFKTFSYCFAVWFLMAFSNVNFENFEDDAGLAWVSRYSIIFYTVGLFNNFYLQVFKKFSVRGVTIDFIQNSKVLVWILLHVLINSNFVQKKTQKNTSKKKMQVGSENDKVYKTEIYVSLFKSCDFFQKLNNLKIYDRPATLEKFNNKYFNTGGHYSTFKPLVHKNKQSKDVSKIGDLTFINLRSQMRLYVRWGFFKFLKRLVFKYYNLDSEIINEKFNQLLEEKKRMIWRKKVQREFNQIFSLNYFFRLEEMSEVLDGGFYFHYYFDFRGRVYADSPISYTNNIFFRHIYFYGYYTENELNIFRKKMIGHLFLNFDKIAASTSLKKRYKNIKYEDIVVKHYVETIFFEIGKVFKNKIIEKRGGKLHYNEFIEHGIKYYNEKEVENDDLDKQIEFWSLIYMLEELDAGIFLKNAIFKDATASGPQILALTLGVNSIEKYIHSNLIEPDTWYDTYYFIIKDFLQNEEVPKDIVTLYFTRSILKKTIMTFNYNATYLKCWDYFREEAGLPWYGKNDLNKQIEPYFTKFYLYLKKIFESNLYYNNPPASIVFYFKELFKKEGELSFCTKDDFLIFLKYYIISKESREDKLIKGSITTRETIVFNGISDEPNFRKTYRALQANLIHAEDAYIIRRMTLELGFPSMTIHDSFAIDILSISLFQKIAKQTIQHVFDIDPLNLNKKNELILKVESNMIFL